MLTQTALTGDIRQGLDFKAYAQIEAANFSTLKELGRSAAHYRHALLTPREDTDAMLLGRAIHAAVLEPERFAARCALWTGERRYGKKWDKFVEESAGREVLKRDQWELALAVQRSVRGNPTAAAILSGGRAELTLEWTDPETGIRLKGRLDYLGHTIADLKTVKDASPVGFGRAAWRMASHVQVAMYQEAVRLVTGEERPFAFIAAETAEPHVVQVYTVPEHILAIGRETFHVWLRALAIYRERDQYPGYSDDGGALELSLPRWAVDPEDEDADGMGLISGTANGKE